MQLVSRATFSGCNPATKTSISRDADRQTRRETTGGRERRRGRDSETQDAIKEQKHKHQGLIEQDGGERREVWAITSDEINGREKE